MAKRKKIERLTAEQTAQMAEFRDRWVKIGLSTEPADRPKAEAAIREAYRCAGLEPPQRIVWCGSPLSQGLTRAIILDKKLGSEIGKAVRGSVGASVWDSVWASVRGSVWDSVWASVRDSVWDSVGASVWESVRDSVGDSVGASVWESVGASVRESVGDSGYGAHDAGWLAFYAYFRAICGLTEETEKLCGLTHLAHHAGWFLPHERICWVSERHHVLQRDERGRLHSLTGPAVAYPDGWAVYAVHGVRVPAEIIEHPERITAQQIHEQANAEVRRVMLSRFGEGRYLEAIGAQLLHEDSAGKLYRAEIPGDEPLVMVRVLNSTPEPDGSIKPYWLRVAPDLRPLSTDGPFGNPQEMTAHNAVASTFGLRGEQYRLSAQS